MPCADSTAAMMPSFMAYGEAIEPWAMPDGCGPMVWDSTVAPFVPHSPSHWMAEAPSGGLAICPVDEDLMLAGGPGGVGSPMNSPMNGALQPQSEVHPATNEGPAQNPKGPTAPAARQIRYYPQHGMRTPSSLGSPQQSATPTEVPSPRPVEFAASSSVDGTSADASLDDMARDGSVLATGCRAASPAATGQATVAGSPAT